MNALYFTEGGVKTSRLVRFLILILSMTVVFGCAKKAPSYQKYAKDIEVFKSRKDTSISKVQAQKAAKTIFKGVSFQGKKHDEVIEILGEPDSAYLDSEGKIVTEKPFLYFIGGGVMDDSLVYRIHFKDGRVTAIDTGLAVS